MNPSEPDPTSPQQPDTPDRLIVGRIIRAWGLHGQVKVETLTDFPKRFRVGASFFVGEGQYLCEGVIRPSGSLVLKFQGVDTPAQADFLRGASVEVATSQAEPLPDGAYYYYQVIGLEVYTVGGDYLGRIAEILATGSNDVYVVQGPKGEVLIPAIGEVVTEVDMEAGRITIQPMPGLLQEAAEQGGVQRGEAPEPALSEAERPGVSERERLSRADLGPVGG
jgi:16S rRNA processing protein RimM